MSGGVLHLLPPTKDDYLSFEAKENRMVLGTVLITMQKGDRLVMGPRRI